MLGLLETAGVDAVRVVTGPGDAPARAAAPVYPGEAWVENSSPDDGMLSSVRLGVCALPAGTEAFLAQVAGLPPAQRQAQLLTQMKLLAQAHITGDRRLQVLEVLRDAVLQTQHARSREYWGKPVPFDNDTREIFERTIALWRTLADAYVNR